MILDDEIRKLESEHYRVICRVSFNEDAKKWMGKVRIQRKDTNEIVDGGCRIFDNEKKLLKIKMIEILNTTIKAQLNALGVPFEWNSRGRLILVRYLQLRSKITRYGLLCNRLIAGQEDKDVFSKKYARFWNEIVEDTIAIAKNIESLTEQERIEILTLPDCVFHDPSDPWNLDEMDSRGDIIKFFVNPSELEINTNKHQTKKVVDLFHQLGWGNPE